MKGREFSFAKLELSRRVSTRDLIQTLEDYARSGAAIFAPVVLRLIDRVHRESAVPDDPSQQDALSQMWRERLYQMAKLGAESQERRGFAKDALEYRRVMAYLRPPKARQVVDSLIAA